MDFNVNKCRIMHIGKRNFEFQYQIDDGWVKSIDEEELLSKECQVLGRGNILNEQTAELNGNSVRT